jgi:hypothetical protein
MPSSMQPCKRYRLRADENKCFVEGYFLNSTVEM